MAWSRRERHRDRAPSPRQFDEPLPPPDNRVFRMPDADRQQIAKSLRFIDEARRALEAQQNPDNREIIRELKTSADRIFDILNGLESDP